MQLPGSLKAPDSNPRNYQAISWFQAFAFKFNLYRYTEAQSTGNPAEAMVFFDAALDIRRGLSPEAALTVVGLYKCVCGTTKIC